MAKLKEMNTKNTRSSSKNQNTKNYIKKTPNNIKRENLRSDKKRKLLDFTQSKIASFDKPKKSKFKGKEEDEDRNNSNKNFSKFEEKITERSLRSRPNPNSEMEIENNLVKLNNLKPKGNLKPYIKDEGTKADNTFVEERSRSDSSKIIISRILK